MIENEIVAGVSELEAGWLFQTLDSWRGHCSLVPSEREARLSTGGTKVVRVRSVWCEIGEWASHKPHLSLPREVPAPQSFPNSPSPLRSLNLRPRSYLGSYLLTKLVLGARRLVWGLSSPHLGEPLDRTTRSWCVCLPLHRLSRPGLGVCQGSASRAACALNWIECRIARR